MTENPAIKLDCPCTEECLRHGNCKDCRAYHKDKRDLSYCKRADSPRSETALSEDRHAHGHHHNHIHGHKHER